MARLLCAVDLPSIMIDIKKLKKNLIPHSLRTKSNKLTKDYRNKLELRFIKCNQFSLFINIK